MQCWVLLFAHLLRCWRTANSLSWSLSKEPKAEDDDPKTDAENVIEVTGIGHLVLIHLHGQPNPNPLPLNQRLLPKQSLQRSQRLQLRQTRQQTPALAMGLTPK